MFPDFNIYSSPLLILVIQGIILSCLLLWSYKTKNNIPNFILGILLLITCYHRTTYTLGFMGWYDVFRNTKINYYLIPLSFAVAPLIYFYIKSYVQKDFRFIKRDVLHFIPVLLFLIYRISVFIYDSMQLGFNDTQNGVFMQSDLYYKFDVIYIVVTTIQMLVYLVLSLYIYYRYRKALVEQYSNTYNSELRWLRNFLFAYSFLFVYNFIQTITDEFIFNLGWTGRWWYQFFSVLIVIYVGVKGYFTDMETLKEVDQTIINNSKKTVIAKFDKNDELEKMQQIVTSKKIYLDPNLSLRQLARESRISPSLASDLINRGLGQNFNDYINRYRVESVIQHLQDDSYQHLSILAIALDNGFNSKATFNRVFKKITGKSPSEYRK